MNGRITLFDDQGKRITLGPNDHIATGGEGSVYGIGSMVYKVFLDRDKARAARMGDKLTLLKALKNPGIAAPSSALLDSKGELAGLALPRVSGEALCRYFTNTWRDQVQFTQKDSLVVVKAMREVVDFAHQHQALMVDGNELNWLLDGVKPVAIDVDSWQLPGFAATAIMPSIQDPLIKPDAKGRPVFTTDSDWFAWAIVTFQLWTGVHPFKGNHPDFARGAMIERMKAGVSVFDAKTRMPPNTRAFDEIPLALRHWYEAVFTSQTRGAPPARLDAAAPQTAPKLKIRQMASGSLKQDRLGLLEGSYAGNHAGLLVFLHGQKLKLWDPTSGKTLDWVTTEHLKALGRGQAVLVRTPELEAIVYKKDDALHAQLRDGSTATLASNATRLWQAGSRIFACVPNISNGLVEIDLSKMGGRAVLSIKQAWPVSTLSSKFMANCFAQDCLGAPFIGVPAGAGLHQAKADFLRGMTVLNAWAGDPMNVWIATTRKSDGATLRLRAHLDEAAQKFVLDSEEEVSSAELEGVVLPSGVGVLRLDDDLVVSKGKSSKQVSGCGFDPQAHLVQLGSNLGIEIDREVVRLSLS